MKIETFNINTFRLSGQQFLQQLSSQLIDRGIDTNLIKCDHLCFRVCTKEEYDFYKNFLANHGQLLAESLVNGRTISTFRIDSPFQYGPHEVDMVELPAPKTGTYYSTGFEHAEFVIDESFTSFRLKFKNLSFSDAGNRILNPELSLKLGEGMQAKFHHLSLDRVIEIEKAEVQDIIFDFDGTLIKSREYIYEINRIVFSKALNREVSLEESIENFHPEFSRLFEAFAITCPTKQHEAITSWGFVSEKFEYELFDGAREMLNVLRAHDFRLHLWTARDEYSARKILKKHSIEEFFKTLSFASNVDSKPHSNSLKFDWKAADPNQVIVVGDSPSDIIGAKNIAAIRGAALWDSHANPCSLIKSGAELLFHNIADLKEWILRSRKVAL
ncbi:MAG: VOC family protein [Pseudobdellovibrionaceae bacterium]